MTEHRPGATSTGMVLLQHSQDDVCKATLQTSKKLPAAASRGKMLSSKLGKTIEAGCGIPS